MKKGIRLNDSNREKLNSERRPKLIEQLKTKNVRFSKSLHLL